ncbi:hypothetical protein NDI76_04525 [Halogeometricum sp. S1BR25-6]|uniref:C2H2-type domain-containing protein n=1 Tax=Halogeometricum salsisoli TaxID=2950536 RepID=A0ABU2GCW2_9EURY|nr:hypothetical protein [Halogeometricum sp. S1BR25-6]MDS0297999.1 hypothetical protein [Halogeometricum sp. S1BR25-6]
MSLWKCGVAGCDGRFETAADAVIHQTVEHDRHECKICGTVVPEGYFAIRHAFEEHSRAEFVRAYDANSSHVRERERVKAEIESETDLTSVVETLEERGAL